MKALDAKFTVDDNALYRHPDVAEMRDVEAGDPQERLAREKGVTYVKLDGEVGISETAPGSSCPRSTSSTRRAGDPRTSATWAAAATRRASWTRSR